MTQGILIFGRNGQVANALFDLIPEAEFLGRDRVDLSEAKTAGQEIRRYVPQFVINASAYTDVNQAEVDQEAAYALNAAAVQDMAQTCASLDIPLVHISTEYVFSGEGDTPWRTDDSVGPLNVYGKSKLAGEQAILDSGCRAVILRTSWVFSHTGQNFVRTILKRALSGAFLSVVNDQIGGPTSAHHLAVAVLAIGRQLSAGKAGGVFHLSGAPDVSWAYFAREICSIAGLETTVRETSSAQYRSLVERPLNSRLECTSTEIAFALSRPDWRAGLRQVVPEILGQLKAKNIG